MSLARKSGVPLAEVVRLSESRGLHTLFGPVGKLVVRKPGEYAVSPAEERSIVASLKPRIERRNISGQAARRYLERVYRPGSTLTEPGLTAAERSNWLSDHRYPPGQEPNFQMTLADKQRMLWAMRTPTAKRRSGRQAQVALMARYPWAVYP
jgi:hypothetical protein